MWIFNEDYDYHGLTPSNYKENILTFEAMVN